MNLHVDKDGVVTHECIFKTGAVLQRYGMPAK